MEKIYKVSFDLNKDDFKMLENMAKERNISIADVIRQALSYYKFFDDSIKKKSKILVEDKYHNLNKVVFA